MSSPRQPRPDRPLVEQHEEWITHLRRHAVSRRTVFRAAVGAAAGSVLLGSGRWADRAVAATLATSGTIAGGFVVNGRPWAQRVVATLPVDGSHPRGKTLGWRTTARSRTKGRTGTASRRLERHWASRFPGRWAVVPALTRSMGHRPGKFSVHSRAVMGGVIFWPMLRENAWAVAAQGCRARAEYLGHSDPAFTQRRNSARESVSWPPGPRSGQPQFPQVRLLLQELAGHDHALDLVGALVDLGDLGVAHHAFDRVVVHVAVAAEELHRVGGD